jgi:hypothetical protein
MDILVIKMSEFLNEAEDEMASDILNQMGKQYGGLID